MIVSLLVCKMESIAIYLGIFQLVVYQIGNAEVFHFSCLAEIS